MAANNFFNLYLKVNDKEAKTTLNSLQNDLKTLYSYRGNLDPKLDKAKWDEASKKIEEVKKKKQELIKETQKFSDTVDYSSVSLGKFQDAFSSLLSGDLIGFKDATNGIKGGIMGMTKAAWAFVATPIGAAIAALAAIAVATKLWFNYNETALEANRITQQMTQLSGDALDDARVRGKAIEKTFGTDFKQSLEVAKNLVQAFGISYEEAFDRIEDGLIRGGKESDEFMKSLKEYPKLFAQAGFTVEEFQRIVNTGIDMGVYDDKLPDAIKEFSLAIMEETTTAREAIENAFGKEFTDKVFKGIQDGSLSSKDALQLISAEAETIGLNAQQAQLLTADLFKGAGEDAGGALVIFEAVNAALNEQVRALTPLEAEIQRVADANHRLEQAQNDALKSDQYSAFVNDISVSWTNFKAGFFEGMNSFLDLLVDGDTAMRKFVFQSVQYVKDAFTIGADADWDKLGAEFDKKQKEMEARAAALKAAEMKDDGKNPEGGTGEGNNNSIKKAAEEKARAAEAAKLREARTKQAIAEEKKRLDALDKLQEEYTKKEQDRLADSAVKKAELDMQRALDKATSLGAEQVLLDEIRAAHQVTIDAAKAEEEEKELERLRAFEDRKKEMENEIELARATSDLEREEIKKQQDLEKEEARYEGELEKLAKDLEFLQLSENEKNAFKELLEQNHQEKILDIKEKGREKLNAQEKKWMEASIKATEDLEQAKTDSVYQGLDVLKSVFGQKAGVFKALFMLEKGLAAGEIITTASKSLAAITANTAAANSAAVAAFPLTAGMPWVAINTATGIKQAATVKINTGMQLAAIAGSVISGFSGGGYTDGFGMGYRDKSGHEVAGVVHTNEYVIPAVVRKDPEVPAIIDYLENKRKKSLGLYADGGDTVEKDRSSSSAFPSGSNLNTDVLLQKLLDRLDQPLEAPLYFGFEAEEKRQEAEKKLKAIQDRAQIKKT